MQTAAVAGAVTDRDKVLSAIKHDNHTAREIADATGLNLSTVIHESEIMNGLYIFIHQGPPCVSYWLKGSEPRGRLVKQNGKLVELPVSKLSDDERDELIGAGNDRILAAAALPTHDHSSFEAPAGDAYVDLPLENVVVHPLNVRGYIDTAAKDFEDLTNSIREVGIQEPLIVTWHDVPGQYRVVMGNRRRTAAEAASLTHVPCIIRAYPSADAELIAMLVENIQRSGLKPTQEAKAFRKLYLAANKDIHAVCRQVGLTQSYISTRIRLLKLSAALQEMVDRREISPTGGAMLSVLTPEQQAKIAPRVSGLKLTEIKELIALVQEGNTVKRGPYKGVPREKPQLDRVTTDEEVFTRLDALKAVDKLGDTWFKAHHLRSAFDDVCLDICHGKKDETFCYTCPVPRFITSISRRVRRDSNDGR